MAKKKKLLHLHRLPWLHLHLLLKQLLQLPLLLKLLLLPLLLLKKSRNNCLQFFLKSHLRVAFFYWVALNVLARMA